MKIVDIKQNTEEWHAWRSSRIGASESAAILGMSTYQTPYGLWLVRTGREPGFTGNAFTAAGSEAEDKARVTYEMLHGEFETFNPLCVEHPIYPTLSASLDGYSEKLNRILEIKYPSQKSHDMALAGEVPKHYWVQIQHQLACCPGVNVAHYWSYREGNGAMVEVKRDSDFIEDVLIPGVIAFKELIDTDMPPPLTEKDPKVFETEEAKYICDTIKIETSKERKKELSARVIDMAKHPKVRCGDLQITSVFRNGILSYYKTTLLKKA